MAMSILSVMLTIIIFGILLTGQGSDAALVTIFPEKCIATLQDAVHISCEPSTDSDEDGSNDIALIELSRNGEDPMVFLRDCSNITYGGDWSDRVKAEGTISKTPGQTYLNVTLRNPMSQDTGIYTCTVLYVDGHGKPKQTFSSSNLVVEKLNVTSLETALTSLTNKITAMEEKQEKRMTDLHEKQEKRMTDLDEKQEKRMTDLEEKQEKRMTDLEEKQEKRMTDLEEKQEKRMTDLEEKQEKRMTDRDEKQEKRMDELIEKVTFTSAFSATNLNSHITPVSGKVLILPDILMQQGSGYDPNTGVYTSPRDGLYVFHVVVRAHPTGCTVFDLDLTANDKVLARLAAGENSYWEQSAISSVIDLKSGDRVFSTMRGNTCLLHDSMYTVFTGYLIKAY